MKCPQQLLLHRLADHELQAPQSERLRAHIEQCSNCREIYDQIRGLSVAVRTALATEARQQNISSILAGVNDYIAQRRQSRRRSVSAGLLGRMLKRPALVLASSTAMIIIVFALFFLQLIPGRGGASEAAIVESISCGDPEICVTYEPPQPGQTTVIYITGFDSQKEADHE